MKILRKNSDLLFEYNIENKDYIVQINYPKLSCNYNIPYILVIPKQIKNNSMLVVEVNNYENENQNELINNALITARNLTVKLKENDNPILIPIIPHVKDGTPYYQQLSIECFNVSRNNPFYRIDIQILNIIHKAIKQIEKKVKIKKKVFFNGYSSSGVFAQRFALIHPEIIDTLCIGGASGSIPITTEQLNYPLGIKDFYSVFNKNFNFDAYKQIKFRYYVGELEDLRKSKDRYDEHGNFAPMHDMSYFNRSVPSITGTKQRELFGINILRRSEDQIKLMTSMGLNIKQIIFKNRTHNNFNGVGVNELGDKFIVETYIETNLNL